MLIAKCLLLLTFTVYNVTGRGLFTSKDDVVILNHDNFDKTVFGSKNIWCVLFYAHWCGHCQFFAPQWKGLAHDTIGWSKYMRIGVVNCPDNTELCRKYDVIFYPTIQTFKPFTKSKDNGERIKTQEIKEIRHVLVDRIKNETYFSELKYRDLDPAKHDSYLVFGTSSSYVPTELALDFSGLTNVQIAISDDKTAHHESLLKQYSVKSVPSIYRINKDGSFQQPVASPATRKDIKTALQKIYHIDDHVTSANSQSNPSKNNNGIVDDRNVHMEDLMSALTYMFMKEIPNIPILQGVYIKALQDLMLVLEQYFPFHGRDESQFKLLFKTLRDQIPSTTTDTIKGEAVVATAKHAGLKNKMNWIGCKGSRTRFRGFPCGVWNLFHTLTVYAYKIGTKFPRFVLHTMTDYIRYFFGCKYCSRNFVKESLSIPREVKTSKDAVMWLWKTHNRVNKRLHGDKSEDPKHPKVQFPPKALCKKCHLKVEHGKDKWNNQKVFEYLVKRYSLIK